MLPKGKVIRLAVDATLRASAPYQKGRRERSIGTKNEGRGVFIEQSDVRTKKMARKAGSLIIFVVDASGSMALNRMNAAKGAAMSLLTEAYQSRDQICLIPFQGDRADVLLPPTRSIAMAKKRLEAMPCGGGSPLADALQTATLTGLNAQKTGDVGKVVVVCISDGRANVPLCVSKGEEFDPDADEDSKDGKPSRQYLKDEVLACAKQMGVLPGFNLLCIDTENKFISTGVAKEIADAAMGKYHQIAKADGNAIASVTSQALNAIKNS
jgi:magnesium chelatase subunit D